ncbi:hypothetical protein [Prescottella equi]
MTEQTPTQTNVAAAESVQLRAISAVALVVLAALAVTGDPDRRWPATAGALALGAIGAGIAAWRGRCRDRAETRATKAAELTAIFSVGGAVALAMWAHSGLWDAIVRTSQLYSGDHSF